MLKVTSEALDPEMDFAVSGHRLAAEVDEGGKVQQQELVQNIQAIVSLCSIVTLYADDQLFCVSAGAIRTETVRSTSLMVKLYLYIWMVVFFKNTVQRAQATLHKDDAAAASESRQ